MAASIQTLFKKLTQSGILRTKAIKEAFLKNDRRFFVKEDLKDLAYLDSALPLAAGQTISQPTTAIFMLELLQPKAGQQILDIGSGSGWVTAMLAQIVGPKGKIYASEVNPAVFALGQKNLARFNYQNVELTNKDYQRILDKLPKLDRITSGAAFSQRKDIEELGAHLKTNGRLVFPTSKQDIRLIRKTASKKLEQQTFSGFVFVPIIHK